MERVITWKSLFAELTLKTTLSFENQLALKTSWKGLKCRFCVGKVKFDLLGFKACPVVFSFIYLNLKQIKHLIFKNKLILSLLSLLRTSSKFLVNFICLNILENDLNKIATFPKLFLQMSWYLRLQVKLHRFKWLWWLWLAIKWALMKKTGCDRFIFLFLL